MGLLEQREQEQKEEEIFESAFKNLVEIEEKIRYVLTYMRQMISGPSPKFRLFWYARGICMPLFKEEIPQKTRSELWQEYIDLSVEARRLREILEEKSMFACEQIDLAIKALMSDLTEKQGKISQIPMLEIGKEITSLFEKRGNYQLWQQEASFLLTLASRLTALRKEVLKTDMKIKKKHLFLKQLSECGDLIFPRRKELVEMISQEFVSDVVLFAERFFQKKKEAFIPLHLIREEIKGLQILAKTLTLSSQAFNKTREELSRIWDFIKELDREKKEEFQKIHEEVAQKVQEFEGFCTESICLTAIESKQKELFQGIKGMSRPDMRIFRDKIAQAKAPMEQKHKEKLVALEEAEKQIERSRLEKIEQVRSDLERLAADLLDLEELSEKKGLIEESIKTLSLTRGEKIQFDRLIKQVKDKIAKQKRDSILSLSFTDQKRYEQLVDLLNEEKKLRLEIKNQIESYRKDLGKSGFDFERAILYREMMEAEKISLDKVDLVIQELEQKIAEMEG